MNLSRSNPLLSVLIPAYRYPEGVARILSGLGDFDPDLVEILIGDDSPDAAVESVVYRSAVRGVRYQRNSPPLGAPANWNALLDAAKGSYCWLLHHDEFPLCNELVAGLIENLQNGTKLDVLILDCVLVDPKTGWNRRHFPNRLRRWVVANAPAYLFRRNVIGPTSALIVRREYYPRFDEGLRWLVDMEVYAKLFLSKPSLKMCPKLAVGSILGRKESITAQLGNRIPALARQEQLRLQSKHEQARYWLGSHWPARGRRLIEAVIWKLLRLATRTTTIVPAYRLREARLAVGRGQLKNST